MFGSPASTCASIIVNTADQVDGYKSGLHVIRMAVMSDSCQRRVSGSDRISELVSRDDHENAGRRHRIRDDWHFT